MLTINLVFLLRKSVNYSVNLFSNRNMNSANVLCMNGLYSNVIVCLLSVIHLSFAQLLSLYVEIGCYLFCDFCPCVVGFVSKGKMDQGRE